jgi:hypothetical protein
MDLLTLRWAFPCGAFVMVTGVAMFRWLSGGSEAAIESTDHRVLQRIDPGNH